MSAKGTYVYCLVATPRRPSVRRRLKGLPGTGPVRVVPVDAMSGGARRLKQWLIVADAPLTRYSESAINEKLHDLDWVSRAAVAHEAVVEAFLAAPALLPMKLFTIFLSDGRALEHVRLHERDIQAVLKRVADREEWGIRVTMDRARAVLLGSAGAVRRRAASGAGYLTRKKTQRDRAAELGRHARTIVADVYDRLAEHATAARRRSAGELPASDGRLLLDAAFLIPRGRVKRFHAAAARDAKELEPQGYHLAITGPWPPYSFLND
jgi:Gas vesicle synthesis protein GvpL/GvpF